MIANKPWNPVAMILFPTKAEEKGYKAMGTTEKKILTIFFKNAKDQVELNSKDSLRTLQELLTNIHGWFKKQNIDATCFEIAAGQIAGFLAHPKENQPMAGSLASRCEDIIEILESSIDKK